MYTSRCSVLMLIRKSSFNRRPRYSEKKRHILPERQSFLFQAPGPTAPPVRATQKPYLVVAYVAAGAHLLNVVGMLAIFWGGYDGAVERDSCFQTTASYLEWTRVDNTTVPDQNCTGRSLEFNTSDGRFRLAQTTTPGTVLRLHWLIVGFHALSAVFQAAVLLPGLYDYEANVDAGKNPVRFVEYSISASIMLLCLALLNGIVDENELLMMGVLCFITQLCGMAAETLLSEATQLPVDDTQRGPTRRSLVRVATLLHLLAWVALMTAYGVIWRYFLLSAAGSEDAQPPDFVYVIVGLLFALFNSFGAVQIVQISRYAWCPSRCDCGSDVGFNRGVELAYTVLSLVAKTLLGWMIYYNVLALARPC